MQLYLPFCINLVSSDHIYRGILVIFMIYTISLTKTVAKILAGITSEKNIHKTCNFFIFSFSKLLELFRFGIVNILYLIAAIEEDIDANAKMWYTRLMRTVVAIFKLVGLQAQTVTIL